MAGLSFDDLIPQQPAAPPAAAPAPGQPPAQSAAPAPAAAGLSFDDLIPQTPPPAPEPANVLAASLPDALLAGVQRTSPVVQQITGQQNYKSLGPLIDADAGPMYDAGGGNWQPVDPTKQVVLRDPQTGKLAVYERNPQMSENGPEGRLAAVGRVLSFGTMSPVTRLPAGAAAAPEVASAAVRQGVPLTPGVAFDNPAGRLAENVAGTIPGSSGTVAARQQASIEGTKAAVDRVAAQSGGATTEQGGGVALKRGAEAFVNGPDEGALSESQARTMPTRQTGFDRKSDALYARVDRLVPETTETPMVATRDALTGVLRRFDNPELAKEFQDSSLGKWAGILDRADGKLSWKDAKEFRTQIGQMLRKGELVSGVDDAELKRVYGALSEDMRSAAAAQGPDALRAFDQASTYYRAGLDRINGVIKQITKQTEGGAYDLLMRTGQERGARASESTLLALRRSIPDDQWGEVSAAVTRRLGATDQTDIGFSPTVFVRNYEKLSDTAKSVLYNASQRDAMDDLLKVAKAQRALERAKNPSGSGQFAITGALGARVAVDPVTTVGTLLGAGAVTRLMMNPSVVRWLAAVNQPGRAADVATNAARLGGLARFFPQDSSLIRTLRDAYVRGFQPAGAETPEQDQQ